VVEVYLSLQAMARLLLFLLVLLFGVSCFNEPDCLITASSAIKIDFRQTKTNPTTLVRSVVDSALVFNSVFVSGIDTAYIKYRANQTFTSVTLPVDPRVKTIKYVFNIRSTSGVITRKDSLEFSYASESIVIAPRCGAYTYFLDLKVTNTNYDSTRYRIVSSRLLKSTTNVQVFF
jgi:tetrahydromethanopterin S-methyltransferase subunit F